MCVRHSAALSSNKVSFNLLAELQGVCPPLVACCRVAEIMLTRLADLARLTSYLPSPVGAAGVLARRATAGRVRLRARRADRDAAVVSRRHARAVHAHRDGCRRVHSDRLRPCRHRAYGRHESGSQMLHAANDADSAREQEHKTVLTPPIPLYDAGPPVGTLRHRIGQEGGLDNRAAPHNGKFPRLPCRFASAGDRRRGWSCQGESLVRAGHTNTTE